MRCNLFPSGMESGEFIWICAFSRISSNLFKYYVQMWNYLFWKWLLFCWGKLLSHLFLSVSPVVWSYRTGFLLVNVTTSNRKTYLLPTHFLQNNLHYSLLSSWIAKNTSRVSKYEVSVERLPAIHFPATNFTFMTHWNNVLVEVISLTYS